MNCYPHYLTNNNYRNVTFPWSFYCFYLYITILVLPIHPHCFFCCCFGILYVCIYSDSGYCLLKISALLMIIVYAQAGFFLYSYIGFIIICFTVQIEGVVIFSWGYGDPCCDRCSQSNLQVRIPPVASLVKCFLYPSSPYTDNGERTSLKKMGGGGGDKTY